MVSVLFCLRVVGIMYMTSPADVPVAQVSRAALGALALAVLVIFYLGILPTRLLTFAAASVGTIF